jgi:hypothetical protein
MVNPWVEFVKQYAKANNISYGHAIKEAGPAYHSMKKRGKSTLRGKGLDELPDVLQEKIGSYLDDKSLGSISNTNKGMNRNEGIQNDLESRRSEQPQRVQAEYNNLVREANEWHRTKQVTRRVAEIADRLEQLKDGSFLTSDQRRTAGNIVDFFDLVLHKKAVNDRFIYQTNNPRRKPWYQRLFG